MKKADDEKPDVFSGLMDSYIKQLIPVEGCSVNTVKSYKDCYALLFNFLEDEKGLTNDKVSFSVLTAPVIIGFLNWLETKRNCTILTRNQRRSALCAFAKYASKMNYRAAGGFYSELNKVPKKRARGKKKSFFSLKALQIFLSLPKLHTLVGRRDSILLVTMYYTGTRAQEICDLKVKDISFNNDGATKVTIRGKGEKTRIIPIPNVLSQKLNDYLKYQGISQSRESYVFSSQTNPQMTVSCVEAIFEKYSIIAKEEHPELFPDDRYTPHSMRHTTAVHMLEAGVPLAKIQRFLGHASIATTQIYAEISQESLDKTMKEWNEKTWSHVKTFEDTDESTSNNKNKRRPDFLQY